MPTMNVFICKKILAPKTRNCMHKALIKNKMIPINKSDGKLDILLAIDKRANIDTFSMYLTTTSQIMGVYDICNYAAVNGYEIIFYIFDSFHATMSIDTGDRISIYMEFKRNDDMEVLPRRVALDSMTQEVLDITMLRTDLYEFIDGKIVS